MGGETSIEWATHSLNFYTWKCRQVSPGCKNCYAKSRAERYYGKGAFEGAPQWRNRAAQELRKLPAGAVVFVNSHSDTYHEEMPERYIHAIHNAAAYIRPDVTFLLLTKRVERVYSLRHQLAWPANLWLGTSVESADYLWRLDYLLEIPAAGHFLSAEPLLEGLPGLEEYLTFTFKSQQFTPRVWDTNVIPPQWTYRARLRQHRLGWVIVGGESGLNRRPFFKGWAAEIRDQCQTAGVPFMYKQGSGLYSGSDRLLNGREWNEMPAFVTAAAPEPEPAVSQLALF